MDYRIELARIIAGFANSVVVAVIGIVVLRRLESIKAAVARRSGFEQKWADRFFDDCQSFVKNGGRMMAVLLQLQSLPKEDTQARPSLENEVRQLVMANAEIVFRVRLSVVFAPIHAENVITSSTKAHSQLGALLKEGGNLDEIVDTMNTFHQAARSAHREMLFLG